MLALLLASYVATHVPLSATATAYTLPQQQQPFLAPSSYSHTLPFPSSPLPWSDLNILSTTDTHGWIRGHPREPLYSATLGDFISFSSHLRRLSTGDFLIVDSGDTLDGNGFVDADTTGVKGKVARELLKKVDYDIVTTGNHELYNYTVALDVWRNYIPHFKGRYLASNVEIRVPESEESNSRKGWLPFGSRVAHFNLPHSGRRVTAFGILFNFDRPDPRGLRVTPPSVMVKQGWWREALMWKDEGNGGGTDVFIIVGHMATRDSDWKVVHDSIRTVHPHTPILYFSGHAHVRDCLRLDERSQVLASGRYFETVGFTSLRLPSSSSSSSGAEEELNITRRYLDTNLATYKFHSHTIGEEKFSTEEGEFVDRELRNWERRFNLSYTYGVAPHPYYLNRYPPDHEMSLINLYATRVFETVLAQQQRKREREPIFLFNTGAARFDIFPGNFTRDDQFAVIPFENGLWSIGPLGVELVKRVEKWLNQLPGEPEVSSSSSSSYSDSAGEGDWQWMEKVADEAWPKPVVEHGDMITASSGEDEEEKDARARRNHGILLDALAVSSHRRQQARAYSTHLASSSTYSNAGDPTTKEKEDKLTYGYVTYDSCPGTPDDTPHRPLPAYEIPDFVLSHHYSSRPPSLSKEETAPATLKQEHSELEQNVDLVFYEFIAPLVLRALNALQREKKYGMKDIELYSDLKANELLGEYAKIAWNQ